MTKSAALKDASTMQRLSAVFSFGPLLPAILVYAIIRLIDILANGRVSVEKGTIIFEVCAAEVALCIAWTLWRRWKYDLHKIPSPPALPFVGHIFGWWRLDGNQELTYRRAQWFKQLGNPKIMRVGIDPLDRRELLLR